jgi:hypothetical protein
LDPQCADDTGDVLFVGEGINGPVANNLLNSASFHLGFDHVVEDFWIMESADLVETV